MPTVLTPHESEAKTNALIGYILMGIGLFTGLFWFVGFIWIMVKKNEFQDTVFADHYHWERILGRISSDKGLSETNLQ
ncbi:hypothetical protein [Vibrio sp. 1180_3]|uniref:hypothetical protein n=1 Tax=Vibrio sp. 1180_3 TaxID=2528832 RepID=UPI0024059796|nr:hypothetical protein [Vibrio sp. 1180_3]